MNLFSYAAEAGAVGLGYIVLGVLSRALWKWMER